jgi:hypothetical protein
VTGRGVWTSTRIGASIGRVALTIAALGCATYDESLLNPDLDANFGGSGETEAFAAGGGGMSHSGGTTEVAGSGGTDVPLPPGDASTDDLVEAPNDATVVPDDAAANRDEAGAVDGSSDAGLQPILHYKFDEASGDVAGDASGNARTGTVIGTHTWVAGHTGNALSLDGVSAFVVLPVGVVSALTEATIATWVQVDASRTWQRIVDFGNNTTVYVFLTSTSSTGKIQLAITTNSNPGQQLLNGINELPLSTWKHVAVVLDGQTASLYVDGALESTSAITLRLKDLGTTANNWLGRSQYMQDPYFMGALDDFRIYDRALTAMEVAAIAKL